MTNEQLEKLANEYIKWKDYMYVGGKKIETFYQLVVALGMDKKYN